MKEHFEGRERHGADAHGPSRPARAEERTRLEEVGDLHFHASAYSSALDYYYQLTDPRTLERLTDDAALRVLRKAVDANVQIGDLDQVEVLLGLAFERLAHAAAVADGFDVAAQRAVFQARQATVLRERGRLHDALELGKRAFAVLALTDEHAHVARLQVGMGLCHLALGRQEKAEEFFNDGLATYRRIGDDLGVAKLLNNLALLHKNRCEWEKAIGLLDKAFELAGRVGASHILPGLSLNKGIILQKINRLGESRALLEKGLRMAVSLGDRLRQTRLYLAAGRLETLAGRLARAEQLILEGKQLADANRFRREATIADEYLGDVLLMRGDAEKARYNYELGCEKARGIASGNDLEGELQRRMGEAHLLAGRFDEAVAASQAAIAVCEECGEDYELGFCHLTLGRAYRACDDATQSDHHFREAIATFQRQNLTHLWCRAILAFAEARGPDAGEAELLLLRRYLMDAQENGAAAVGDDVLCDTLEQLARVQIRLGQADDALLTVFELERHAAGLGDRDRDSRVVALRGRIEEELLGGSQSAESHLRAISELPGLFSRADAAAPRNLEAVLGGGMEKVQADAGFLAMAEGGRLQVAARRGLTENLAAQLMHWFEAEIAAGRRQGTIFFSRVEADTDLARGVPAAVSAASSCVFLPIALHERRFGLLYLARNRRGAPAFDRAALDFLTTYMGFLSLFLYEKALGAGDSPAGSAAASGATTQFERIITADDRMFEVLDLARKVAPSDLTVLLNGETGTGKGLLAQAIHALSRRSRRKFLSINCAAIPETLLESELFGHRKGSFTGAHTDKKGLLAEAEGGTVFLDEIGKMPFSMQGKLLHFLDTKVVRPVGSNLEQEVDVRIVCASKLDLRTMADQGRFLEDLYYRLLDFPLTLPPLRERPGDIELLARHFVDRFSGEMGVGAPALDPRLVDRLVRQPWPGNVRELEKTLKRALVLAQGEDVLRAEHLPAAMNGAADPAGDGALPVPPLKETLASLECREIGRALEATEGNKSAAARMLKISYPNLLKKIKHYGLG